MRLVLAVTALVGLGGCGGPPAAATRPAPGAVAETVAYPSKKETVRGLLYRPPGAGPFPAVVAIHGDFGLTDGVKDQARRLAEQGYVTLAVDLYRGETPGDVMDAHILGRGLPDDRVLADIRGAVDSLAGRPDVRPAAVGIVGWGMGGGYALDAARADPRLRAVVVCCGRLTTDAELLGPLNASVLGIFAGKDEGITPDTIRQFEAAMHRAGKRVAGIHIYPDCDPGFLDPSSPGASAAAARADAWKRIDAYLAAELQRPGR
jgi:carboxymethylenebutenolidase